MTLRPAARVAWFALALGISISCGGAGARGPTRDQAGSAVVASSSAFAHASTGSLLATSTSYGELAMVQEAPMSLTASDGSGLTLTRLEAKAVVQGPLAFTELHLYFHNPEARIREGTFSVTLPAGAALSRFAMENEQGWMEAEVVEKMAARRAYEDFLHRKQDPALLEQAAGNQFSARVFPIPANGDKHLVISYSQELTSTGQPYVLPLRGLPAVGAVDVSVMIATPGSTSAPVNQTLSQRAWKPDRDFVVATGAAQQAVAAVGSGEFVAARVAVPGDSATVPMGSLAILVDSSASRALGYAAQIDALRDTVVALRKTYGDDVMLDVAAFDQDVQTVFHGRAADLGEPAFAALRQRQALGASNLGMALDWLASSTKAERVLLIGDGVVTAGATAEALGAKVKALAARGTKRFDVALVGAISDRAGARALAAAGLPDVGVVVELGGAVAARPEELARRMALPVRSDLTVAVDGADWVWPATAAQAQPGDEIVVYAAVPARAKASTGPVAIRLGGKALQVAVQAASAPLVTRAAAQAEIARLEAERDRAATPELRAKVRAELVAVSVAQRVLSSETALLVLESDADYARFGIARTALSDILVVGAKGLELQHRAAPVVIVATAEPVERPTDSSKGGLKLAADDGIVDIADKADATDEAEKREDAIEGAAMAGITGAAVADVLEARDVDRRPAPAPAPAARTPDLAPSRESSSSRGASAGVGAASASEQRAPRARIAVSATSTDNPLAVDRESDDEAPSLGGPPALTGRMASIMDLIGKRSLDAALKDAMAWHAEAPGDVLALLALGEAFEARAEVALAARAYGSIIDLFSARADLRRFAGERLERLAQTTGSARDLIIDTYQRAVEDRPDHLSGHRMLAMALVRAGRYADALAAIEVGLAQAYPSGRFAGGERILTEDAGLIAAAWLAKAPSERAAVTARLDKLGARVATSPSTRFVLYWETDGNDVDFHIRDAKGGHAYYSSKQLRSGGELYEDVTTGYGPECFTIPGLPKAGPYQLDIHYYSRGPMGYGMGVLEVLRHDGKGGLTFENRPYVAMNDQAYVDLGKIEAGAKPATIAR